MRRLFSIVTVAALVAGLAGAARAEPDWARLDTIFQREGAMLPGGARRFAFPRSDLRVTLDGVAIRPALALGSWLAFLPMDRGGDAMVMGDLVLTQQEVAPVMRELFARGLDVSALHNHVLRGEPATMYMHVSGHGDAVRLAEGLRLALGQSQTPIAPVPTAAAQPPLELDTAAIDAALGRRGTAAGGVYAFSVPRAEPIREAGMAVPASMGLGTAINFQPVGGGRAAITGDFVLVASEVNPVARALVANGIEVTAIHNHLLGEEPRLVFMHFWAVDDAAKLARALRGALDLTNSQPAG